MQITLGQQYNVGEKPTVIILLYIKIINRHACRDTRKTLKMLDERRPRRDRWLLAITLIG